MIGRALTTMLVAAALLAGCAGVDTSRPPATAKPAAPVAAPSPVPAATATPRPTPASGDPAAIVARSVPASRPRLLPAWIPAGMAPSTTVSDAGYTVVYTDDLHTKEVFFTDEFGVNPPLPTSQTTSAMRRFRSVTATYVVYDSSAPASQRYLLWDEPGTWPTGQYGMPTKEFFLEAHGLTEGEFFQVANSLQPVG